MTKEALNYALAHVKLPPGRTLWLYGDVTGAPADAYTPSHQRASALKKKGHTVYSDIAAIGELYDAVIVQCPKQQEEAEGLIALALQRSRGTVMAIAANDAGGNRLAKVFAAYGVETEQLAKDRCKIVVTKQAEKANRQEVERNVQLLMPHRLAMDGHTYWTVPGLFGWNKIDIGSALLAEHLPETLSGNAADFGCGFGYLTAELLRRAPGIVSIDAYDVDARAIAATLKNCTEKVKGIWQDLRVFDAKPVYDVVVMNPPFHSGKEQDIGLGETFIRKGYEALRAGGQLFVVANRMLPYEQIVPQIKTMYAGQGYKVMAGRKA